MSVQLWSPLPLHLVLPGGQVLMQVTVLVLPTWPFAREILGQIYREGIRMEKNGNIKPLQKHTMPEYIS